ncbi:MAG: glycosyltransferase 87 family protein [Lapillicoccus sp.]
MRLVVGTVVVAAAYLALVTRAADGGGRQVLYGLAALWVVAVLVTWWVRRGRTPGTGRKVVLAVVMAAAVAQLPGVLQPPRTSSDAYRYVWDGRVQLSGTSPYRYAPLDDRLADLRDPLLFPGLRADQPSGYLTEPLPTTKAELAVRAQADPRTLINRPRVPTIYPPVAELWFTAVAALTPWSAGTRGLQVASAALAVALAAVLALWRRRRGGNPYDALWWAWSPTALLEAGNGAHVDIVAAAFVVLALAVFTSRRMRRGGLWLAGTALGLAAATKLFPLVLAPALAPWSRERIRDLVPAPLAAVGTVVLSYLPHVIVAGALVLGYLPGYLSEEGGGARAAVLRLVLPDDGPWLTLAVGVVLVVTALWAVRRVGRTADPTVPAVVLFGVFLLASTPAYPWYALTLVVLAVLSNRLEWIAVAAAMQVAYAGTGLPALSTTTSVVATVVVVAASVWRARRQRRRVGNGSSTAAPSTSRTT